MIIANEQLRKAEAVRDAETLQKKSDPPVDDPPTKKRINNHTMAECRQHFNFSCGHLLQTRGD